jgi:ubiquinone/menaquinone biosynthesis C-methylase UbiE
VDDPAASQHYNAGIERDRLLPGGEPRLELARTLELLERYLPPPPAAVLDVGGGPGVYASRLARDGYRVTLIDVLPLHVEQAAALSADQPDAPFATSVGDARQLEANHESADAVLLLGPLYHLTEREHRLRALREARRVLRVGGVVIGAAISRRRSRIARPVRVWEPGRGGHFLGRARWAANRVSVPLRWPPVAAFCGRATP